MKGIIYMGSGQKCCLRASWGQAGHFSRTEGGGLRRGREMGTEHDVRWPVPFQWPSIQPPSRRTKWGGIIAFSLTNPNQPVPSEYRSL